MVSFELFYHNMCYNSNIMKKALMCFLIIGIYLTTSTTCGLLESAQCCRAHSINNPSVPSCHAHSDAAQKSQSKNSNTKCCSFISQTAQFIENYFLSFSIAWQYLLYSVLDLVSHAGMMTRATSLSCYTGPPPNFLYQNFHLAVFSSQAPPLCL